MSSASLTYIKIVILLYWYAFQMLDEWFLYAYSNYSDYFPLLGNILNISKGPAESLVIKHADIVEGS